MNKRISAPTPRGVVAIEARRALHETRVDALLPACLMALNRGTPPIDRRAPPPTGSRMAGGTVVFEADSSGLDGRSRAALDRCSAILGVDRGVRVLIGSFTSERKFTGHAVELGLRRVQVIRAHLRSRGVGPGRIDVAVCGAGWFLVERTGRGAEGDPSGRCLIEIVDPHRARWRN